MVQVEQVLLTIIKGTGKYENITGTGVYKQTKFNV